MAQQDHSLWKIIFGFMLVVTLLVYVGVAQGQRPANRRQHVATPAAALLVEHQQVAPLIHDAAQRRATHAQQIGVIGRAGHGSLR